MDKNSNQYESIKNKLLKLQALAEKATKAKRKMQSEPLKACVQSMALRWRKYFARNR